MSGLFKESSLSRTLGFLGLTGQRPKKQAMGVPTIDQARQNQQEADRIRRRRGSLGNIFGGADSTAPTVATKQLLGV